jgi:hypothetical protein
MGHTLVTRINQEDLAYISAVISATGIRTNKIPFGRNCDREAADRILPYHFTVFQWAKPDDEKYLRRLKDFKNPGPCSLKVTGTSIMYPVEEGAALLYFDFEPDQRYGRCVNAIQKAMHGPTSSFYHITIAVSMDYDEIEVLKQKIDHTVTFPFIVRVEGFDLYHIWKPVKRVGDFS